MIIGITGTLGAGKGTIVEYLKTKGFKHCSAREFITREIVRRGLPVSRDSMVEVANDLRAQHGPAYVVEALYQEAKAAGGATVIESIRTPGETEMLHQLGGILLAVDADQTIRYDRIISRGLTETDKLTFDEFKAQEDREMTSADPNKQNLKRCIDLADHVIRNDGTFEELHNKVDRILEKYAGK